MSMLPTLLPYEMEPVDDSLETSRTWKLDRAAMKLNGMCDEWLSMQQTIDSVLHTERYMYSIYDQNHGAELMDLVGKLPEAVAGFTYFKLTDPFHSDVRVTELTNEFAVQNEKDPTLITMGGVYHTIFGFVEVEV